MKNSSARAEPSFSDNFLDIGANEAPTTQSFAAIPIGGHSNGRNATASIATLRPQLGEDAKLYAETSRLAGRLNATSVSEAEHRELLAKREELLKKKLFGSISKQEQNKLQYVRWSLDRIEDAKHGHILDQLENAVAQYERFSEEVSQLMGQLNSMTTPRRHGR